MSPAEPVDEMRLRAWLAGTEPDVRFAVVAELVSIIRPFGRLSADIISPDRFDELASLIGGALARRSGAEVDSALAELEATPALAGDEEPDGVGFYALGAVVELIYAARLVSGDGEAAVHALARASDVIGFADDELGTDVRVLLLAWLAEVASNGAGPSIGAAAVADGVRSQVGQLES
jgi:hypothetical protein